MSSRPHRLAHLSLVLLGLGLTTASCGNTTSDPLAPYLEQKLAWAECDPTIVPADYASLVTELGQRVRCAGMRVPLDHADPSRGEAVVALMRIAAEGPAPRKGAILFNPGGPGDDGLFLGLLFASFWTNANPQDPVGALFKQVSQTYDLVGFSPRGVGASTRLYCGSNELLPFVRNMTADRSPANVQAMLDSSRLIAEACRKNPLTPFINTEATVRDLDLVRHLLGDAKLNYWGYSYGTWLGTWYASRHPERVGRMVLGGMLDVTGTLPDDFLAQGLGMQRVLDGIMAPYAARHPARFALGSDADAVRAVLPSLSIDLRDATTALLSSSMGAAGKADTVLLGLRAAQVLQAFLDLHPDATEDEMAAMIDAAVLVPAPDLNGQARAIAQSIRTTYFKNARRERPRLEFAGSPAAQWTITCNDTAMTRDAAGWIQENDRLAALYPFTGGAFSVMPCLYWGGPSVSRPPLEPATRAGGMVILQSQFDPQTPLEGARKALAVLPNASILQLDGEYVHGIGIPYGRECTDIAVGEYLVHGRQPGRETICQGKPLPADATARALGADGASATFRDPAAARRVRDEIGRMVGRGR